MVRVQPTLRPESSVSISRPKIAYKKSFHKNDPLRTRGIFKESGRFGERHANTKARRMLKLILVLFRGNTKRLSRERESK